MDSSLSSVSCNKAYLFSELRKKMDDSFLYLQCYSWRHRKSSINCWLLWQRVSSARVMLIKDSPLIWPLSMFPSIRWVSRRLRLRVQRVAFHYYIKKLPGKSIYTRHRKLSDVWRSTTRSTRGSFCLSQRQRWNHRFCMWTETVP